MCYNKLSGVLENTQLADENIRYVHASSICRLAEEKVNNDEETIESSKLVPFYLRLPQAERELKLKK